MPSRFKAPVRSAAWAVAAMMMPWGGRAQQPAPSTKPSASPGAAPTAVEQATPTPGGFGVMILGRRARPTGSAPAAPLPPVTPEQRATAFRDTAARGMLERARRARLQQDAALVGYEARAFQRQSASIAFGATAIERTLMRHEDISLVRWTRGAGAVVEVKGARTRLPTRNAAEEQRESVAMAGEAPIPYYPGREPLWIGNGVVQAGVDGRGVIHPLADGAEAFYTYATGDSVRMTLSSARQVMLRELRVEARAPKWNLVVGSFWFDAESAHLVRAVYRLSTPLELWTEPDMKAEMKDLPWIARFVTSPMRTTVNLISVEYGLYEERVWLPTLQVLEASASVGGMRMPVNVEQRFRFTSVSVRDSGAATAPVGLERPVVARDPLPPVPTASERGVNLAVSPSSSDRSAVCNDGLSPGRTVRRYGGALEVTIRMPCDTASLSRAPEFVGELMGQGESVVGTEAMDDIRAALKLNLQAAWKPQSPVLVWGLSQSRYNRVEGFSTGVVTTIELGKGYAGTVGVRGSLADRQINGEVALARSSGGARVGAALYRRLSVASDFGSPLSVGASLAALTYAGDEGFYYRAWGGELAGEFRGAGRRSWRVFAEHQWDAPRRTSYTLFRGAKDSRVLPNITAAPADQLGIELRSLDEWRYHASGLVVRSDVRVEGAVGTYDYGRGLADVTVSRPMPGGINGALTGSVGLIRGLAPPQREFQLGGFETIRGIRPGTMAGHAYWMVRGELTLYHGAVRPVVFADAGWAGRVADVWSPGRPLSGIGFGASLLDGVARIDVARGLYPQRGIRINLSLRGRY